VKTVKNGFVKLEELSTHKVLSFNLMSPLIAVVNLIPNLFGFSATSDLGFYITIKFSS
jgi:hypothetical protein